MRPDGFPLNEPQRFVVDYNTANDAIENSICVVDSDDPKRIATASVVLAERRGIALVIPQEPQGSLQLPAFVVTSKEFAEMKKFQADKISILLQETQLDNKPSLENTDNPWASNDWTSTSTEYCIGSISRSVLKVRDTAFILAATTALLNFHSSAHSPP